MPKLWTETIDAHRSAVRDATLDAAAALVAERGLRAVTMSQIAERTGIGRATLYKYFPDVDAILLAWHERHVGGHLATLVRLRDGAGDPAARLAAVLGAYAQIQHEHHGTDLAALPLLHQGAHVAHAQEHLGQLVAGLLREGAERGEIRADVAPAELAAYCLHALGAAASLRSAAAVRRLVAVTLAGLRPPG